MADRYWVGGSGTWDATSTTNWSETSGGVGGASAPTSIDDVYFNGNSDSGTNFTVTVGTGAVCRTFDANTELPLEYTMTFAGAAALGIYGSLDLPATRFTRTYSGQINFLSSATGNTINTNGVVLPALNFNNVSGGWILNGSLTSGTITFNSGTFDTAGHNITLGVTSSFTSNSSTFRQLYFRNSTITAGVYSAFQIYGSNLTVDSGTSTIIAYNQFICNGGTSWYNLELVSVHISFELNTQNCTFNDLVIRNSGDARVIEFSIGANNTFNNLIIRDNTLNHRHVRLLGNQTINGTLTVESSNLGRRWAIESDIPGTKRTITSNSISLTDVDFRDITAAGASIPWSGTRIGDAGGNSNITFTTPKTVYWNKLDGGAWNSLAWALMPSGTPSLENVPLPQDTAIISDTGLDNSATISIYSWNLPNFDASSRTLPFNLSISAYQYGTAHRANPFFCGDIKIPAVCTITDTGLLITNASNNQSIQCNTTIPNGIVVNKSDGTLTLQSNISTSGTFTLTRGTLNLNALVLTSTLEFNTSSSQSRTINFNNGSINCGANWNATTSTNLLLTGPGSILMSGASAKSFIGGTKIYDGINLIQNGLGTLTITGTNTFGSISNNVLTSSGSTIIFPNVTTTLQNKPSLNGLTGSQLVLSRTGTSGTFTLSYSGSGLIQLDNVSVSNSVVQPTSTWNAFRSTDGGGNTGWISFNSLNAGLDLYWVGGAGTWDSALNTNWALVSGGSGGVSAPTSANNVFFDGNSDAGSAFTVTIGTGAVCKTFDANVNDNFLDQIMTLSISAGLSIRGSLLLPTTNFVRNGNSDISFSTGDLVRTVSTNGVSFDNNINFDADCEYNFSTGFTNSNNRNIFFNAGIINTNSFPISSGRFILSSANLRQVNLANSTITISGGILLGWEVYSNATNLVLDAATSTLRFTYAYASLLDNRTSGKVYNNIEFTSSDHNIVSEITCNNLSFLSAADFIRFSKNITVNGTLTILARTSENCVNVFSDNVNSTVSAGSVNFSRVFFKDITAAGASAPWSGSTLGNLGNNTNIIFPEPKTVYWASITGASSVYSNSWSFTPGGLIDPAAMPLPQDTGKFTNLFPNSGQTIQLTWRDSLCGLDFSERTNSIIITSAPQSDPNIMGDFILGSGVSFSNWGTREIILRPNLRDVTLNTAGISIPVPIIIASGIAIESSVKTPSINFAVNVIGNITSTSSITLTSGTLNTNNYNITCGSFSSSNSNQRAINLGTSKVTLTGTGTVWNTATTTNLTLNAQNSTIALKNAGDQTFAGGGLTYGKLVVENP